VESGERCFENAISTLQEILEHHTENKKNVVVLQRMTEKYKTCRDLFFQGVDILGKEV